MKSRPFNQIDPFRLISSRPGHPFWNMAVDEAIVREVSIDRSPPTLRFYTWDQPSVSIGYFQKPATDLDLLQLKEKKIPWVRRTTGGRAIFHNHELTYSFSAPLSLSSTLLPHDIKGSYQKLGLGFARGFEKLGLPIQLHTQPPGTGPDRLRMEGKRENPLCFSSPSWYEILLDGKKVVGSAQKRLKKAVLQQGTILLTHRLEDFKRFFRLHSDDTAQFIGILDYLKMEIPLQKVEESIIAGLEEELNVRFISDSITKKESEMAEELTEMKYQTESWNMNRLISAHSPIR